MVTPDIILFIIQMFMQTLCHFDMFPFIFHHVSCPRYLLQFQEPIPCEQVVSSLCDVKQAYTQFGG